MTGHKGQLVYSGDVYGDVWECDADCPLDHNSPLDDEQLYWVSSTAPGYKPGLTPVTPGCYATGVIAVTLGEGLDLIRDDWDRWPHTTDIDGDSFWSSWWVERAHAGWHEISRRVRAAIRVVRFGEEDHWC